MGVGVVNDSTSNQWKSASWWEEALMDENEFECDKRFHTFHWTCDYFMRDEGKTLREVIDAKHIVAQGDMVQLSGDTKSESELLWFRIRVSRAASIR